jgi:ClpP class serine protease
MHSLEAKIYIFCAIIYIFMTMNNRKEITSIKAALRGMASKPMFIDRQIAINLMNQYNGIIESVAIAGDVAVAEEIQRQKEISNVKFHSAERNVVSGKFSNDFDKVPKNSVAVVPVMGAMMRDSYCTLSDGYISGTRDLETTLRDLDNNQNVDGVVLYINTPGGEARGNESLSKVVNSMKKPIVGFFEGMASAGVYAFQGVNELYAAEKNSYWGSIGTYVTLIDDSEFWKQSGIEFKEIYAEASTEKNATYRAALEGDDQPMLEWLKEMNNAFIKDVKSSRPQIQDDGSVFAGKLYTAAQAKKIGAIDGIKNLDFAIQRVRTLSKKGKRSKKANQATNQNEIIMGDTEKKLSLWNKLFGASNADEVEQDIEKTQVEVNNLKNQIATLTESNQEKDLEIKKLGEQNATMTHLIEKKDEEMKEAQENLSALEGTEFDSVQALADDHKKVIEHNKELGGLESSATPISESQTTTHEKEEKNVPKERTYQDIIDAIAATKEEKEN